MVPIFPSSSTYFFWLDISLSYDWNISRSCKYFVYQIWAVNVEWQAPRGPGRCQKVMGTRAQTWHYHRPAQLWHTLPCSPTIFQEYGYGKALFNHGGLWAVSKILWATLYLLSTKTSRWTAIGRTWEHSERYWYWVVQFVTLSFPQYIEEVQCQ